MEKKIGNGSIKYRLPNFAESQIILGELGIGTYKEDEFVNHDLIFYGNMVKKIKEFVKEVSIGDIKNYDDLLDHEEYASDISEIVGEFITKISSFNAEKKS